MTVPFDRKSLRRELRAVRREVDGDDRTRREAAIAGHTASVICGLTAGRVAAYRCDDGEVDLDATVQSLRSGGVTVTLPVLREGLMSFRDFAAGTRLVKGDFGLEEPSEGAVVAPEQHAVVLAPLVAFDAACNRMGRGGGHYDRAFGPLRQRAVGQGRPLMVGIAFEAQRVAMLPTEDHDVPMDVVVTDRGVRWCSPSHAG